MVATKSERTARKKIPSKILLILGIVGLLVAATAGALTTWHLLHHADSTSVKLARLPHPAPAVPSNTDHTFVMACTGDEPVAMPASLNVTCGDGSVSFTSITWTVWNALAAIGSGSLHVNDCKPNCADGALVTEKASVVLSQPHPGPGAAQVYGQLAITIQGPNKAHLASISHTLPQ